MALLMALLIISLLLGGSDPGPADQELYHGKCLHQNNSIFDRRRKEGNKRQGKNETDSKVDETKEQVMAIGGNERDLNHDGGSDNKNG